MVSRCQRWAPPDMTLESVRLGVGLEDVAQREERGRLCGPITEFPLSSREFIWGSPFNREKKVSLAPPWWGLLCKS